MYVCVCVYEVEKALEKYSVKQRERGREGGREEVQNEEREALLVCEQVVINVDVQDNMIDNC